MPFPRVSSPLDSGSSFCAGADVIETLEIELVKAVIVADDAAVFTNARPSTVLSLSNPFWSDPIMPLVFWVSFRLEDVIDEVCFMMPPLTC